MAVIASIGTKAERERANLSLEERSKLPPCEDCPVVAANRPVVRQVKMRSVEHSVSKAIEGACGEKKTLTFVADDFDFRYYRNEVFRAMDGRDGFGTRVDGVYIGCKNEMSPEQHAQVTTAALIASLDDGKWVMSALPPPMTLSVMVEFLDDGRFVCELKGKVLVEETP